MEEEILKKLETWADPLKNELQYDGIPLWIYFRQMFLTNNFPNRYFRYSVEDLKERFIKNKIKNKKLVSYLTRKIILLNELSKIRLRKKYRKIRDPTPKALFHVQAKDKYEVQLVKIGNVFQKVKEDNKIKTYLLSYEPIEKNNINRIKKQENMIYEYINYELIEKAKLEAKKLNKIWKEIPESKKLQLLEINEKSLYIYIKEELDYLFSKEFLFIVLLYHEAHKKILIEENIKVICSQGAGTIYPKTLFSAGRMLNIPRLTMQHGICFSYTEKDLLNDTLFAVFGEKSKQELIEDGIPPGNIIITGPAIYDKIIEYKKIKPKQKQVTLMTNGFYIYGLIEKNTYFSHVKRWLSDLNQLNLDIIIKLHPEEKDFIEYYKNIAKDYKNVKKIIASATKEELYELIAESELIINFGSSVALESMMLDKPVITITDLHNSKIKDFDIVKERLTNSGASVNISKNDNMSKVIEKVLKNINQIAIKRKKFLKDSCYKLDGKSSERVVRIIYNLLKNQKQTSLNL